MIKIKFDTPMVTAITMVAGMRELVNMHSDYTFYDMSRDKYTPAQASKIFLQSVGAEYALYKALGLWPAMCTDKYEVADITLPNGDTIDVKYIDSPQKNLALPVTKVTKQRLCNYYVLVSGSLPEFCIHGYATSWQVLETKIRPGNPDYYLLAQYELITPQSVEQLRESLGVVYAKRI